MEYGLPTTLQTPSLRVGGRMLIYHPGFAFVACLLVPRRRAQEVFIGNPGKSLNFFHFDLAIELGFFKELGLRCQIAHTKCDIAVTALLTGDLQATGCVGSASRFIASQNVPVRTVIWLFKKPTFTSCARPDIKSRRRSERQDDRHQLLRQRHRLVDEDLCAERQARSG